MNAYGCIIITQYYLIFLLPHSSPHGHEFEVFRRKNAQGCCCLDLLTILILSLHPSSVPDLGAGPEGEGLVSGLVHPEEGQPAEEPGDQHGAEERGVRQAGEPAQEGSEE